ncbi:KAP family NTPase [Agrobacterium tumefaciens]|nr:KAP family NTPase [Agrobacterium tumefaciens]
MSVIRRSILIDEPSNEDHFNGKGHERTAIALSKAIANFSGNDRAIGLDGPWGSGKSTVVEIARKILAERKTKENRDYRFFTFDIWQSQGSSFRRSLLEHFLDWTIATFPKHRSRLEEVEAKVKGKVREVRSTNQSILDWWGVLVIMALPFLPLYYFWAKSEFDALSEKTDFFSSNSFMMLAIFIGGTFLWALRKMVCDWKPSRGGFWTGLEDKYRAALSQTLLIGSKQVEDQRVTQYIREIDPNDFEFQTTLREILSIVQSDMVRVVIVLDNIDRLPRKEINEYWAQVRAVFSGNPAVRNLDPKKSVTVIVPYHRHLVEEQKFPEGVQTHAAISPLGAREIFTKTFDEILQVSPPVMSNSREFFIAGMGKALPEVSDSDELFRVYLIFDRIIRNQNGSATPRQIIGFINELASMYVLHGGRFKLPTVAVYIAYQDALEANPGLLNDPKSIEARVRQIADDADLEQNLSAMIFNVDPDLALQLMLDQRIKDAAIQSAEKLIEISNSAGFDVRVDQVIQENTEEWGKSSELASVVANFAALSKVYKGDANAHFRKSLVSSVIRSPNFSSDPKVYEKLLSVIELAEAEQLPLLVRSLASKSQPSRAGKPNLQIDDGVRWAAFLGGLYQKLMSERASQILPNELREIEISSDPRFLFGFAAHAKTEGIRLGWLGRAQIDFAGEELLYATYAFERPAEMRAALEEMAGTKLIGEGVKTSMLSELVEQLSQPEIGDLPRFRQQIELTAELLTQIPFRNRANQNIANIFSASPFFTHLTEAMESSTDSLLGSALFLAMQFPGQMALTTPTKQTRNGLLPDETEDFAVFANALTTGEGVTSEQLEKMAELHNTAAVFSILIADGAKQPDNQLTNQIIKFGLTKGELPRINLQTVNGNYDFLKKLLGEAISEVMKRFDKRIDQSDISKIGLHEFSVALLRDIRSLGGSGWTAVREHVAQQLQETPVTDWRKHLVAGDDLATMLSEMIEGASFKFNDPSFRDVVVQMMLDVLAGRLTPSGATNFDLLMKAIEPSFHGDMYRQMREGTRDVTPATLSVAVGYFPKTVSQVIRSWDHLRKDEKDGIIRFFLCAAIEGSNNVVLSDFEALGHAKIKDMIAASQESTREKLHGAMTVFSESLANRERARQLGELFYGKRKAKSFWEVWFGAGDK